jgi:hypothetical protein
MYSFHKYLSNIEVDGFCITVNINMGCTVEIFVAGSYILMLLPLIYQQLRMELSASCPFPEDCRVKLQDNRSRICGGKIIHG